MNTGRRKMKPSLRIGLFMMGIMVTLAVCAPLITHYDPYELNLGIALLAPCAEHPFGTDQIGRDVLARVLYAGRVDLSVMVLAEIAPFVIGTFLGMAAGYFGGKTDWIISLCIDTFIAFPYYLLVIVVAFATGAGIRGIFITFMLVGWLLYARVAKGMTASLRTLEWVDAARLQGFSGLRIILKEILPNVLPQSVVVLMTDMAGLLVMIVTLGYLGIGISAPTPDWGTMISEGQVMMSSAWWISVIPGLAVVLTGIALSFIGDGLADLWREDGF